MTDAFRLDAEPGSSAEMLRGLFGELQAIDEVILDERDKFNEVIARAMDSGFDGPTLRRMVMRARKDPETLMGADALLETYEAIAGTGAGAAGTLKMEKNADGVFEAKMLTGAEAGAAKLSKLSKLDQARRSAMAMAELAARAREGGF